jgi:hypothetical protein
MSGGDQLSTFDGLPTGGLSETLQSAPLPRPFPCPNVTPAPLPLRFS